MSVLKTFFIEIEVKIFNKIYKNFLNHKKRASLLLMVLHAPQTSFSNFLRSSLKKKLKALLLVKTFLKSRKHRINY